MSILKKSFAGFIAILAITVSIASYAGAFSGTKLAPPIPGKCYQSLDNAQITGLCNQAVDFCATDVSNVLTTPGTCLGETAACCYLVTEEQCSSNPIGFRVQSIECGVFTPEE